MWRRRKGDYVPVLVFVLLVDAAHERSGRWQDLVDEDEDGLLRRQLDALADHIDKLSYSEVGGDKILLLVDRGDVGFLNLLADDGDTIGIFLSLESTMLGS